MKSHWVKSLLSVSAAAVAIVSMSAHAAPTTTWTVEGYKAFNKGEAKDGLITSNGDVKPGFSAKHIEVPFKSAWSMASTADGTVYVGTDDKGAVYRVRGNTAKKFVSLPGALAVSSLSVGKSGTVYAGTLPDGKVWAITKSGQVRELAKLKNIESVWAVAVDRAEKNVYAGTGPKGVLWRVNTKSGSAKVVFESGDKRVQSVLVTTDGAVWFGTSEKAIVYRYDVRRKSVRAMADFAGNEVTALADAGGSVVAAANNFKLTGSGSAKPKSLVSKSAKKDSGEKTKAPKKGAVPGTDAAGPKASRSGARKGKGAVFRIRGDGELTQLHALSDTYFASLAVTPKGVVLAGAGDKGHVYAIDADDSVSTMFDVGQRVVAGIASGPGGIVFLTADAVALYRAPGKARKATYNSDVLDTKVPSRFGKISWRGTSGIALETRTGNTAKPGKGWSVWKKPGSVGRDGGLMRSGRVASPIGRYLQFRAVLSDGNARLSQATVYYLPQNRATEVKSVELKGVTVERKAELITLKDAPTKPRSPVVTVKWEVDNKDGDKTAYVIEVRREGEVRWRRIHGRNKALTGTEYKWNTETFPDGYYQLRVTASDKLTNPKVRALESRKVTPFFVVDNVKPELRKVSVKYPRVTGKAVDNLTAITEIAFSVDDGPWRVGDVGDRIFDQMVESIRIGLPKKLGKGMHSLSIRAADEAGNIGTMSTTFRVR